MKYDSTKATRLVAEGSGIDCAIVVMSTRTPRRRSQATAMRFALNRDRSSSAPGGGRTECLFLAHPTPSAEDRFLPFPPIHWAHLDRQQRVDSGGSDADARHPEGDKIMRLHAQTATIENGFVWLPEAAP